ncbi:MAG TPA: SDR family NAD(P)-dependent oxidoreductase [Hanamia sp.]|nr:SDR family NAD(P)-dependent oxidoreductase [Hanamia sp.]
MSSKIIIVTGSAGNLGQAVVKKFIGEDYHVVGTVRNLKEPENKNNINLEKVKLDLMNEGDCQKFVDGVVEKFGTIDVAVLTAGGFSSGNLLSTNTSDIAKQYQLNFETAYNIARPVFTQMMKQNKGRIFLIGSQAGLNTSNAKAAIGYGLSKSLIFRLAEVMNAEAKKKNVVVSVIVPGIIDTPSNRESMPEADFNNWVTVSQIADVIYFYSSDEGSVIREPVIKVYNNA